MIKEGVIGHDEYSCEMSWLKHRMREVAGVLRPIDAYYTDPTIDDAPGYRAQDSDDDETLDSMSHFISRCCTAAHNLNFKKAVMRRTMLVLSS
jgi:hypothetical protein